jgi:large subunit ribosomal protein L23
MNAPKTAQATRFNPERLLTLLLAPIVSEKATHLATRTTRSSSACPMQQGGEIKAAVELLWKDKKIEVASVQIVNVHGKSKRFGAYNGRRRNWKKAYVCLKPGQEITFAAEA